MDGSTYLLAVGLLTSGYALAHLLGPAWLKSGLVFNLIGGASVAALILGARSNSRRSRLPLYLLAIGQGLFVASDVLADNYERLFGGAMPSSLALNGWLMRARRELGMPAWQDHLFISLSKQAIDATEFFSIPSDRVVELGAQVAV